LKIEKLSSCEYKKNLATLNIVEAGDEDAADSWSQAFPEGRPL
jgi:hypothetical protein